MLGVARSGWRAWSDSRAGPAVRVLALAGCATLFLSSAATVHVVYTIRVPYALFAAACVIGFPWVTAGWRAAPTWVRWSALALAAVYVAAAIVGTGDTLGVQRAGGYRDLVYLADLMLGLAIVGLMLGLWADRPTGQIARALALAAGLAGLYAAYQWPARHFGLPFADINNTLDSNGVTSGRNQGVGLFGWERVRGTFLEPHFLGAFLAALFPVSVLVAWRSAGRRRVVWAAGVAAAAMGMLVAVSVPAYGALSVGIATAAALFTIGRGWHGPASVISAIAVVVCVAAPVIASSPRTLSAVTGRTESQLVRSSGVRSRAWSGAVRVWSGRPVLGFGPGQSSVQLARQQIAGSSDSAPVVLSSAQGLWAASLIDAGVLGFGAWALFLAGVLVIGARQLVRRPSPLLLAVFAATVSVAVSSELAGDRLETTAWVLFAALLATAASSGQARGRPQQPREQAGRSSNQGAGDRPRAVGSTYRPGG